MIPLDPARLAHIDPDTDPLLTVAEAAAALGVAPSTVQSWVQRDWVAVAHIKGRRHVLLSDASEVEHWARTKPGRKRVRHADKRPRVRVLGE